MIKVQTGHLFMIKVQRTPAPPDAFQGHIQVTVAEISTNEEPDSLI